MKGSCKLIVLLHYQNKRFGGHNVLLLASVQVSYFNSLFHNISRTTVIGYNNGSFMVLLYCMYVILLAVDLTVLANCQHVLLAYFPSVL